MIKNKKISIIGAGIAGIVTAISLIEKGYKVEIFESKNNLGGRAGSINSKDTVIDIGQHIFLGTYKNFINILKKLNVMEKIKINNNLYIPIIDNKKKYYIKSSFPYFPFSILFAILGYKNLSLIDRFKIIYALIKLRYFKEKNKDIKVLNWLYKNKQNNETVTKFWSIICKPAFNQDLEKISILHFNNLFEYMIFKPKQNISICYLKEPFTEVIQKEFSEFLKKFNSKIFLGEKINEIKIVDNNILLTGKKQTYKSNNLIVATNLENALRLTNQNKSQFKYTQSSIINIYYWFDNKIMTEDFIAFTNSDLQWVFSKNLKDKNIQKIVISLSDSDHLLKVQNKILINDFEKKLREELKINKKIKIIKSKVIRSPKATQNINNLNLNKNKNIHFVGDWTMTTLPNTLESAAISGVNLVKNKF
jgi:protoporphyrinogen oxidase